MPIFPELRKNTFYHIVTFTAKEVVTLRPNDK